MLGLGHRLEDEVTGRVEEPRHLISVSEGVRTSNVWLFAARVTAMGGSLWVMVGSLAEVVQIAAKAVEPPLPDVAVTLGPVGHVLDRPGCSRQGRHCASRPLAMRPACSSTRRCFETAGRLIAKGAASSDTVQAPEASRARIARRVGIGKAANVVLEVVGRQLKEPIG